MIIDPRTAALFSQQTALELGRRRTLGLQRRQAQFRRRLLARAWLQQKNIEEMLLGLHELLLSSIGFGTSLIGFFEGTNHLIVAFLGQFRELDYLIMKT